MSLQRGSNIRGWSGVTKNLAANSDERAAWRFSTASLLLVLLATGMAALLLAQVDIPVISKALLAMGVLLFTTVLVSGVYSTLINRAVDENFDHDRPTARQPAPTPAPPPAVESTPVSAPTEPQVQAAAEPAPNATEPEPAVTEPSAEVASPGVRPAGLDAARGGVADDLTLIKGVGPKMAALCNSLGFYHFDQIAAWTADEVAWVDDNLEGFKGRVSRDDWVAQAKILSTGGETEFSARQN